MNQVDTSKGTRDSNTAQENETLTPREARRRKMDERCPVKRLVKLIAGLLGTALLIVACGAPTAPPAPPAQAQLDCTRDLYPCRFSDVDVAVIARSMALGELAQQMFLDGDSAEQVGEMLAAEEDVAYLGVGEGGVVFRLEGGRPVVVNPSVDELVGAPLDPGAPLAHEPSALVAGTSGAFAAAEALPSRVVGGDAPKSAIVLSPFAYEFGEDDSAGYVAGLLNSHPDYQGRVMYKYSAPYDEVAVTVDDLLDLDEYDVVYLVTHGGRLCVTDKVAPAAMGGSGPVAPAGQGEAQDCRTDLLLHRYAGDADDLHALDHVGIVLYYGSQHQSVAVTSDFFANYYPFGLPDTLFVLLSCDTFAPDFAQAITGDEGVFVSWDGKVSPRAGWGTASLIEVMLEKGSTVSDALYDLGDDASDPVNGGRLRSTGRGEFGDLRIRNILGVEEAHSGDDLRTAVETRVLGTPGDGQPDSLLLLGRIDGAWEHDAMRFEVSVSVGGQVRLVKPLDQLGEMLDEFSWEFPMEVELGRDALLGEVLDVAVTVRLPEGGTATVSGSPRVVDDGPADGWFGTFTYRAARGADDGISYQMTATALFALPEGADPYSPYPQYFLDSGEYSFLAEGTDGYSCMVHAEAGGQLDPSSAYLRFDMTGVTPLVSAWGNSATPPTSASVTCPDGDFYQIDFATDTLFLYIPKELNLAVSGDSFAGSHTEEGPWDKTWTWSFERRE